MILLLSAGRKESVEEIIDEIAYPFEYKTMSISSFAAESMQSLGHIKILVCDLDSLPDKDDSIVDSLSRIRNLYADMNIVLISEYEERKSLYQRLYAKGLYNLIDKNNMDKLKEAMLKGLRKEDVSHSYQIDVPDMTVEQSKDALSAGTAWEPEHWDEPPEPKEEIFANREFKKYGKSIFVGVGGTERGVGTTHFALETAKFLNDIGFRACYLEAMAEKKISAIEGYKNVMKTKKGYMQYKGVNIYYHFRMSEVQNENYDFFIFDRGTLDDMTTAAFLYNPIQILVADGKIWKLGVLQKKMKEVNNDKLSVVLNFITEEERSFFSETDGVYFAAVNADPFVWQQNTELFKRIFAKYITVKTAAPVIEETQEKRKWFPFGRRK